MLTHVQPMLIDDVQEIQAIELCGVAWVLVVEKEVALPSHHAPKLSSLTINQSTFRTLASSEYYRKSKAGNGIILTVSPLFPAQGIQTKSLGNPGKRLPRPLYPRLPASPLHIPHRNHSSTPHLRPRRLRPRRHRHNVNLQTRLLKSLPRKR